MLNGPSKRLPSAIDLADLFCPKGSRFHIYCSDRKDFYHQLWASDSRMVSNTVGPAVELSKLSALSAYGLFLQQSSLNRYRRARDGDLLAGENRKFLADPNQRASIAFRSVLQGDHGGVEYATSAHESLLMRYDCLQPQNRLIANRPLFSSGCCDGLVIDDFFAISVLPGNCPLQECFASRRHHRASQAYAKEDLLGSPLKDVLGSDHAKVIGGALNSSAQARSQGVATLASPLEKRLGLSWIAAGCTTFPYH